MENREQPAPPRGRPRGFDRAAALETAMRLFWKRGFAATSIAELATATGLNPPSLYAAFGDKKRLFAEAVAQYRAGPGDVAGVAFAAAPTGREAIGGLLERAAAAYGDPARPPGCMVIHAGQNCAEADDDMAAMLAAIRREMETAIEARLRLAQEAGELPPEADPAELAAFFFAMLQGMSAKARDGAVPETLRRIARRALAAWPDPAP